LHAIRFRTLIVLLSLLPLTVLPLTVLSPTAAAVPDSTETALDYLSGGWSYKEVLYDAEPGFEEPKFDATPWAVGRAAFGTADGACSWNTADSVHTAWNPGSDLLLRHSFALPAGASSVHINGTIDNNADVYVNGLFLQHVESGFCAAEGINVDVPASSLNADNVIAIRSRDTGGATFIDVQITYRLPTEKLHAGTFIDVLGAPQYENVAPGEECTTAFSVRKGNSQYVLGAAHCLLSHGVVNIWQHGSRTIAYATAVGCGATGLYIGCLPAPANASHPDFFAWQPDGRYIPDAYVMTGKGLQPVLGEVVPNAGDKICHFGKGSGGEVCGEHVLTDSLGDYGTKAQAVPGDSGGPAYQYVKAGKKQIIGVNAVGIVVEGQYHKPNGSTRPGSTIIPIRTITAALSVDLITES
jgi:hypothetical protein